ASTPEGWCAGRARWRRLSGAPSAAEALFDPEPSDGVPELGRAEFLTVAGGDGRELPASRRQLPGDARPGQWYRERWGWPWDCGGPEPRRRSWRRRWPCPALVPLKRLTWK